jgi:hypothetical protein
MDIHTLLNRQAGQPVRLTIKPASGGEEIDEVVTPEPYINGIVKVHSRWVEQRKVLTEKLCSRDGSMNTDTEQSCRWLDWSIYWSN